MDRVNRSAVASSSSQEEVVGHKRSAGEDHGGQDRVAAMYEEDDGGKTGRPSKKPRLVWTTELHQRFLNAVNHLGVKSAVPKTILQLMNVEGMTRENVASHLQKYRLYLKRLAGLPPNAQLPDDRGAMGFGGQFPPGDALASLQAMQGHGMKLGANPAPAPAAGSMIGVNNIGGTLGHPQPPYGGLGGGSEARAGGSGMVGGMVPGHHPVESRPGGGDPRVVENSMPGMISISGMPGMVGAPGPSTGAPAARLPLGWPEYAGHPPQPPHQGYLGYGTGYGSPGQPQYGSMPAAGAPTPYLAQGVSASYTQQEAAANLAAATIAAAAASAGYSRRMGTAMQPGAGGQPVMPGMSAAASMHAVAMAAGMLGMQGAGQGAGQLDGRRWWGAMNPGMGGSPELGSAGHWHGGGPEHGSLPGSAPDAYKR